MRSVLAGLFVASALFGQTPPFDQLKSEAWRTRALLFAGNGKDESANVTTPLRLALRDWIESRLPQTLGPTGAELHNLEAGFLGELHEAGISVLDSTSDDPGFGYVGLKFQWLPELPDSLVVITSVGVGCGSDQAVYLYQFHSGNRTRVVEDHPQSNWGFTDAEVQLSEPGSQGQRLLLTHYVSVQCASFWMQMAYSVYRLGGQPGSAELLLTDQHSFYLNDDGPIVLRPDELIIEFLDSSVDGGVHNRTRIHRYSFARGVQRVDPVAFQPQDFAEEWLTRPWSEMESRSVGDTREWHQRLHSDPLWADYSGVIPCTSPGHWLVSMDIRVLGDKELSDPLPTYFLLRDLGDYHYSMDAVSTSKPTDCLGAGVISDGIFASDKHPWLSTAELKALR
jgi:hypothetical protein